METTTTVSHAAQKSGIRWKRVLLAGVLAEIGVIAIISAIIAAHSITTPGLTGAETADFASLAGYYVAAPAAALMTFIFALWAARALESQIVVNGVLVGLTAVLLSAPMMLAAKPEDRPMYIVSFALRLLAGYCGAILAQKLKARD
jgi:hypothetical protein